jgi:hypothetical protein
MSVTGGHFTNWNIIYHNAQYVKIQKYTKDELKKEFLRMVTKKEIRFGHLDHVWVKRSYW